MQRMLIKKRGAVGIYVNNAKFVIDEWTAGTDLPGPRTKEIRAFARGLADALRKGRLAQEG
jgi:hypothetical protein